MQQLIRIISVVCTTVLVFVSPMSLSAQSAIAADTLACRPHGNTGNLIAAGTGIALGTAVTFLPALEEVNPSVQRFALSLSDDVEFDNTTHYPLDDVMQLLPWATTVVLKVAGVPSRHNYVQLGARMAATAGFTMLSTVVVKQSCGIARPDNPNAANSFFSGHTATAFAGAELLRLEYGHLSPWVGVGAYTVAATTGMLRMYHNRHWLGDVLTGAGAGIVCAQLSYWLCDRLSSLGTRQETLSQAVLDDPFCTSYQLVRYDEALETK